jgi:D-alanine-D-alanine ligase
MGYTRADIRMDAATEQLYVLEVNAQCGLSEDENYTSIGAILRVNQTSFTQLIWEVLLDALQRSSYPASTHTIQKSSAVRL